MRIWQKNLNDHLSTGMCRCPIMGALAWPLSHTCASPNVDVAVLHVVYQPLLQTLGKDLLTSVRFRYLIP
jgi:hypothetical protein